MRQTHCANQKVLILVVAYNAEKTIGSVLARIPIQELPAGTEVCVVDDSSADGTFEKAREDSRRLSGLTITILRNPVNQGYGGNQKIGYQYAIENGFDVVVLLHGDGQYAPEKMPALLRPVLKGEADACFGSRMMESGAALKRGMPLYKYVGNRILTTFQNRVLGMNLSEFHSGYRVYAVDALKQIPFRYNTNDFHFDTEIIIQFHLRGLRIKEVPIPTYYGDEICYVNGLSYAWHVILATLGSRIQGLGILFQRKFDVTPDKPRYEAKLGYVSSHTMAIMAVKEKSSVLDLASGSGEVACELRKKGCRVAGTDRKKPECDGFERFVVHDLDSQEFPDVLVDDYDYILALDCVEHLSAPEAFLSLLRSKCYADGTSIIFTVPNIGFFITRVSLMLGQFNYGRLGILDMTHKRLFTFGSFLRMLEQEGYLVQSVCGIPAPFVKVFRDAFLGRFLLGLNQILVKLWPRMFAYQIYVEASFAPPLERLLARTIDTSRDLSAAPRACS